MTQFLNYGVEDDLDEVRVTVCDHGMARQSVHALLFVAILLFAVLLCAALCGCASTPTGVRVVASSATATNLGDINWDEYKIPVFSVYTGPKTTIWINRDYLALSRVTAGGCVTNDTSALGVYRSREQKQTRVEIEFSPVPSACPVAGAQASAEAAAAGEAAK